MVFCFIQNFFSDNIRVRIFIFVVVQFNIRLYDKDSPGPSVSFTNKTDRHDITEILLKV
jgi:hypothetical protein